MQHNTTQHYNYSISPRPLPQRPCYWAANSSCRPVWLCEAKWLKAGGMLGTALGGSGMDGPWATGGGLTGGKGGLCVIGEGGTKGKCGIWVLGVFGTGGGVGGNALGMGVPDTLHWISLRKRRFLNVILPNPSTRIRYRWSAKTSIIRLVRFHRLLCGSCKAT